MSKKNKVLIVEDEATISELYKTKLEAGGFEVFVANNGADGLKIAKEKKPHIVILDVILPQLDGFSVLEEIKKDSSTKKIPVIMLTNLGTDEDKEKGKKMGAQDYLVKSNLTPAQVEEVIKKNI